MDRRASYCCARLLLLPMVIFKYYQNQIRYKHYILLLLYQLILEIKIIIFWLKVFIVF